MKIERETKSSRVVDYFGYKLAIPNDINWIATDATGNVYGYKCECMPELLDHYEWESWDSVDPYFIGRADLEGMDCKETLVRVEE